MWQGSHALITPNIGAGPLNGSMHAAKRIVEERARKGGQIRVAMVGAGALARVIALQLATDLPEVRLVAIADRDLNAARGVYAAAGGTRNYPELACALRIR
jgi:predicted homoserine dehydrogenase-like protein